MATGRTSIKTVGYLHPIHLVEETLTDESKVYDLEVSAADDRMIVLSFVDRGDAIRALNAMEDALTAVVVR